MKDTHDSINLVVNLDEIIEKAEASGKDPGIFRTARNLIVMGWDFEDDLQEARKLFETSNPDFAARTFLRTLASEFEARLHMLSEILLHLDHGKQRLSAEELLILKEISISLGRNGKITSSRKFYPFLDRLRFVLGCYERIYDLEIFFDKSDARWISVKKFIEIRNRITHPRSPDDLWIDPNDYDHLNHAQDWIRKALKSAFPTLPKQTKKRVKRVKTDPTEP